jgi:demethylmenaquinone methyltransferase/2-methoxy-6-polyprenyl-1,4-benzoquinol methylase
MNNLAGAFDSPDSKRRYTRRLFHTISGRYDFITRFLSFGQDQAWKEQLMSLADLRPGVRVLDLACGTGDLAFLAASRGASVVGLDFTPSMIDLARAKPEGARVTWLVGDMGALPVSGASFDRITTGYGIRNVPDLATSLGEMHRVLRPGGRLCVLDFDRPESPLLRSIYLTHLTIVGSTVGWLLHGDPNTYRYIPESIRRYPGARGVVALLQREGFRDVRHVPLFGGLMALHVAVK